MQTVQETRLPHEEDSHITRTFLISTKPNKANWQISKKTAHEKVKSFLNKDFYIIPKRMFQPLEIGRGGHVQAETREEEYKQIADNSHGKITEIKGPFYYNDGTDDYKYKAIIKFSGSKTASVFVENGKKAWVPFSVSPHIWPLEGPDDDITDWEGMGLALVIKGAYGDEAVVDKYCSGGASACQKSLAAAIDSIGDNYTDDQLASIINSHVTKTDYLNLMSQVQVPQVNDNLQSNQPTQAIQTPQVQEIKQEENNKNITLTKEEYDSLQTQLKNADTLQTKVTQLENNYKTNILGQLFNNVQDENTRKNLTEKYFDKDVDLVKSIHDDVIAHIVPSIVEAEVKKAKDANIEDKKSKTASILKPEPKKVEEESKVASISEPTCNEMRSLLFGGSS